LKLYGVLITEQPESRNSTNLTNSTVQEVKKFSASLLPSIAWENERRHFQELGIGQFRFQRRNDYRETTNTNVSVSGLIEGSRLTEWDLFLHYSYNLSLIKEPKKFRCFIGFGLQPGLSYEKNVPTTSASFNETNFQLRLHGLLIPRTQFQLGQRIWLDVHIPVHVAHTGFERYREENPQLPTSRQVSGSQFFELIPQIFEFRTGLVYLL
jgi:hypothetical protein